MKIEDIAAGRDGVSRRLQDRPGAAARTLNVQNFIAGTAPAYADHIVFGALQWGRMMSATPLLEADDPIVHWMDAVLGTYGL